MLTNLASVQPGDGLGFGPRHIDFHPTQPWVFVSVERQSQLYVYRLQPDHSLAREPMFVKNTLADRGNAPPPQAAGAIHVHPNGRFVYLTNRNSGTVEFEGKRVSRGGENNIAVFSIDPASGEPTLIQNADAPTIHLRTFAIDPSGRMLVAASIQPMLVRDGNTVSTLTAGMVVYRIGGDGKLTFVRKYDVDTGKFLQFWTGIVTLRLSDLGTGSAHELSASRLREARLGARLRLLGFDVAVARRAGRLQRCQQAAGRRRDLVDRAVERRLVDLGGTRVAAQLAHELQRGGADLVVGRGRREIEQRTDVPAHRLNVLVCTSSR